MALYNKQAKESKNYKTLCFYNLSGHVFSIEKVHFRTRLIQLIEQLDKLVQSTCYQVVYRDTIIKSNNYLISQTALSENDFNFTIIKLSPMYLEDIIQLSEPSFECNDVEVPSEFRNSLCANLLENRFNVEKLLLLGCRCKYRFCKCYVYTKYSCKCGIFLKNVRCRHYCTVEFSSCNGCCNIWKTPYNKLCAECKIRITNLIHVIFYYRPYVPLSTKNIPIDIFNNLEIRLFIERFSAIINLMCTRGDFPLDSQLDNLIRVFR
jgi:hypothetical protein